MKRVLQWLPAVVWMSVIFYFSHQTGDDLRSYLPFFQQWFPAMESFDWGHFLAYFILGGAFYWALLPASLGWKGKAAAVALCFVYGLTDEYHQTFVDGRTPDLKDLRNDTIGAALAMLFLSLPWAERTVRRLFRR